MIQQEVVKLAPRGQIVIPKIFRDMLHLKIGERLFVKKEGQKLVVEKAHFNDSAHYEDIKQKRLDKRLHAQGEIFV